MSQKEVVILDLKVIERGTKVAHRLLDAEVISNFLELIWLYKIMSALDKLKRCGLDRINFTREDFSINYGMHSSGPFLEEVSPSGIQKLNELGLSLEDLKMPDYLAGCLMRDILPVAEYAGLIVDSNKLDYIIAETKECFLRQKASWNDRLERIGCGCKNYDTLCACYEFAKGLIDPEVRLAIFGS